LITQGLPDLTEPEVGAKEIIVGPLESVFVVIHEGRVEPSVRVIAVIDPVFSHESTGQDRIAGLEV